MEIVKLTPKIIVKAAEVLKKGGVVVFPTDTVYGLICDAYNKKSVEKIFKIKKRPKSKPLAIFAKDIKATESMAFVDKNAIKKYWPGKYTIILKLKPKIKLSRLVIKEDTIGVRVPKYKWLNNLFKRINKPLAQTSANISEKKATAKIKDVLNYFENKKHQPDLIIDAGNLVKNKPSKIIDLTNSKPKIIRN